MTTEAGPTPLLRLAEALGGVDRDLDRHIHRLRQLTDTPEDAEHVQEVVEQAAARIMALDLLRRATGAEQPAQELLATLGECELPRPLELQRRALLRGQPEWRTVLALTAEAVDSHRHPGLLERLFARPGRQHPTKLTDAPSSVPGPARDALINLIDRLVLPEGLHGGANDLKARLGGELTLAELPEVVERLTSLVTSATREENERMERFLKGLTGQLEDLGEHLIRSQSMLGESASDRESLAQGVRSTLSDLHEEMRTGTPLEDLRRKLEGHLQAVSRQLDNFLSNEQSRRAESEAQIETLQARIERAESEADNLRSSLIQQQLRAQLDPLTQVANREAYDQRLDHEYERWRRHRTPLTVLFGDVDHFKHINDEYGHASGDAVLQAIAGTLRDSLRRTDLVARYGGEEFIVLMPGTAAAAAATVAEKLRAAIAVQPYVVGRGRLSVTISFGVAEFQGEDSPAEVLERADQALYEAKRQGRNRVITATNNGS